jgi:integrase
MKTQKVILTKKIIPTLKYAKENNKRDIWWDKKLSGFGVRLYPSGKKRYVIQYRYNRRLKLKTIGDCELLTLTQAQDRARRDLVGLLDNIDPLSEREQLQESATFEQLCSEYMERYSKPFKKSWNTDQSRVNIHLVPRFGNLTASSIVHNDIALFHTQVGKLKKPTANRLIKLISVIYTKCISWGMLPENYKNPAKGITFFPEQSRDRWLTPVELPRLIKAINEEDVYARSAIWLALLVGLRKNELLSLEWSRIDLERLEITVYETKNTKPLYLPISSEVLAVIDGIPKVEGNQYLFAGRKEGTHLKDFKRQWDRVRKKAGVTDVRWHDLRRTLGSWLAQSGNTLHLIAKILNHKDIRTTQVYARFAQDDMKEALDANSKKMVGIGENKEGADIINISQINKG